MQSLSDIVIDLIDYCAHAITQLIGFVNSRYHEEKDLSDEDDFERQKCDLIFKIGIKCISILSFVVDGIDTCSISAKNRLIKTHDVPCLLSEILHIRPWLRRKKLFEKFIDNKWITVRGDEVLKVTKTEAHAWFAFRQILLNQSIFQNYDLNNFRQRELAKVSYNLNVFFGVALLFIERTCLN